ncbi:MAG: hypothetical protein Q9163_001201 [Psora crenata]
MDGPAPLEPPTKSDAIEKPLPPAPPPSENTPSKAPVEAVVMDTNGSPSDRSKPPLSSHPSLQRLRRRVVSKRNKACIIILPLENEGGHGTNRQDPLKPQEVAERLKKWEERGLDTTGFVLAPASANSIQGQSRAVHPDPADEKSERLTRSYRVSIPDWREWEAYVNRLKEEKLRALGVSFGNEDQPFRESPRPSLMSTQASSQSSAMPTLPSLQASSMPPNSLGPSFQLGTSQPGQHGVSHFPRYSAALPFGDKGLQYPNQFPQSQSPDRRNISPLGYITGSRIGSPIVNEQVVGAYSSLSPVPPPAGSIIHPVPLRDSSELLAHVRQQQSLLQAQQMQQQHNQHHLLQPIVGTSQYSNNDTGPLRDQPHADLITPMPRGHRQNLSESLQREVEEAEIYLETAGNDSEEIEKGKMNGEYVNAEVQEAGKRMLPSEVEKSRVILPHTTDDTTCLATSGLQNVGNDLQSKQGSIASISSNVEGDIPKFEDETTVAVTPDTASSLEKQHPSRSPGGVFPLPLSNNVHTRKSSTPCPAPKFNVAAPVFLPGAAVAPKPNVSSRVFSFGTSPTSSHEADKHASSAPREFSFSSKTPTLNPDAPVFKPGEPVKVTDDCSSEQGSAKEVKKIFGSFKFTDGVKAAKKSKALPIVKPKEPDRTHGEFDDAEDESGRITQADARQKRMRRNRDDGDQVPQFATPKDILRISNGEDLGSAHPSNTPSFSSGEKEPTTLEAATDMLEEIIDDMTLSEISSLRTERQATANEGRIEPFTFHNTDQAASFNAARPPSLLGEDELDGAVAKSEEVAEANQALLQRPSESASHSEQGIKRAPPLSYSASDSPSDHSSRRLSGDNDIDRVARAKQASPLRQDVLDGVRYVEPSFHDIDVVMKHLNQAGDSDVGVEREQSPWRRPRSAHHHDQSSRRDFQESVSHQLLPPTNIRSDAPSPSPNRLREPFQYLPPTDTESVDSEAVKMVARNARYSPSFRPSRNSLPIHYLNSPGSTPPSDWNDAISSIDEIQLKARTGFFDSRVNDVLGHIVQQRLSPLEEALTRIHESLAALSKRIASRNGSRRPRSSGTIEALNSDADDEEEAEDTSQSRLKSPLRDRKYSQLKASISEIAIAAQQGSGLSNQLAELLDAINDIRSSVLQTPRDAISANDIKTVVEEAVNRQMRGKSAPVMSSSQAAAEEKSQLQIAGLESMLKIAETRAEDEMKARRATEDALADNQRLLRQALHEAAQQRESAEATERSLQEYHEERQHNLKQTAILEVSQESLEKIASELSEKNEALESTLAEYRLSHDQWRTDIDNVRHENKDLHKDLRTLKAELETIMNDRSKLRARFDQLRDNIASASRDAAAHQSYWRSKQEEQMKRLDSLSARLETEARTRERLGAEIERLETQENEAVRARFQVEKTLKANAHLDKLVGQLRSESHEHQNAVARLQRELHAAEETGIMEVHRTRSAMEVDIKAAKSETKVVRAELEDTIIRLQRQLEEASDSGRAALSSAAEAHEKALQEHYRIHEKTVEQLELRHQRSLHNVLEDKRRSETTFGTRLSLADEKLVHLQDKITHLENKLDISKSAAHAAVQAAQANKTAINPSSTRAPIVKASDIPEKISPQALRESILVLQEQLQARESLVEELEAKLAAVDADAPAKLKDANIEITWLRELLGVRKDDLQDIITALSQPSYDRETVRDAAIRLEANVQMEQQEKERALSGAQIVPSLSKISNLAASPKALPLAAAAAWGNWRKGRDPGFGNLGAMPNRSLNQTPSKPSSSPQSFFAGLMTPPSTNMRSTPPLKHEANSKPPSSSTLKESLGSLTMPRGSMSPEDESCALKHGRHPVTPPLMRKASYDSDAPEAAVFGNGGEEQHAEGECEAPEEDEPFGPKLGTFAA